MLVYFCYFNLMTNNHSYKAIGRKTSWRIHSEGQSGCTTPSSESSQCTIHPRQKTEKKHLRMTLGTWWSQSLSWRELCPPWPRILSMLEHEAYHHQNSVTSIGIDTFGCCPVLIQSASQILWCASKKHLAAVMDWNQWQCPIRSRKSEIVHLWVACHWFKSQSPEVLRCWTQSIWHMPQSPKS